MTTDKEPTNATKDQEPAKKAKYLLVKVVDTTKEGWPAVNIRVPIRVVNSA
jgi:hypothetical protein